MFATAGISPRIPAISANNSIPALVVIYGRIFTGNEDLTQNCKQWIWIIAAVDDPGLKTQSGPRDYLTLRFDCIFSEPAGGETQLQILEEQAFNCPFSRQTMFHCLMHRENKAVKHVTGSKQQFWRGIIFWQFNAIDCNEESGGPRYQIKTRNTSKAHGLVARL
jgi:hypothetical protein